MEGNNNTADADGYIASNKNTCFKRKVENGQNVEGTNISDQSKKHKGKKGLNITDAGSNPSDISSGRKICPEGNETEQTLQESKLFHESQKKRSTSVSSVTTMLMSAADPSLVSQKDTQGTSSKHDLPKNEGAVNLLKECVDIKNGLGVNDVTDVVAVPISAKMSQSAAYCEEEKTYGSSSLLDQSHAGSEQKIVKLRSVIMKAVEHSRRKLLILDVNGLLADIQPYYAEGYNPDTWIAKKAVFKRPFCDDFLQFCFETFDVGIWSSRNRRNVESVVDFLMGYKRIKLLFCWNQDHCTNTGYNTIGNKNKPLFLKEIKKLWDKEEPDLPWEKGDYNASNTLLIDDSPYKALRNPPYTGIFPHPFTYKDFKDKSLGPDGDLLLYLQRLAAADDVQKFVKENPIGQRPITKSNLSWTFYSKIVNATDSGKQEKKGDDRSGEQENSVKQEPVCKIFASEVAICSDKLKDDASCHD